MQLFLREQGLNFEILMPGVCSVFAELKREIIPERIHAGLTRARALGRTLGRKPVSAGPRIGFASFVLRRFDNSACARC